MRKTIKNVEVEMAWEGRRIPAYEKLVKRQIGVWLDRRGGGMVSVLMTTTPRVQSFNRKYRKVSKATAVMSFPQGQSAIRNPQSAMSRVWGDVVIAVDAVRRYARLEQAKPEAILKEFVEHGLKGLLKS